MIKIKIKIQKTTKNRKSERKKLKIEKVTSHISETNKQPITDLIIIKKKREKQLTSMTLRNTIQIEKKRRYYLDYKKI